MSNYTIFTRYLNILGVPFTFNYSNMRFRAYPAKLGIIATEDLLGEYGAEVVKIVPSDNVDFSTLKLPALIQTKDGKYLIVTKMSDKSAETISVDGNASSCELDNLRSDWNGKAVCAADTAHCAETNYKKHVFMQTSSAVEKWLLIACTVFLVAYFGINSGVFSSWATSVLLLLYAAGIYICRLLILKQSNSESKAADNVCKVIQQNGCSTVLHHDSAALFGLFPWCEIGMTYFSVSFLALLLWPPCLPWLAAASACCLPYTIWSVSYQKFKIHAWCTLCLCVQTLFWIIFFVCLAGGCFHNVFPLRFPLVVLLSCYLFVLLFIHKLLPRLFHADLANAESNS